MGEVEIESREESRIGPRKKKRGGYVPALFFYEAAFLAHGVGHCFFSSQQFTPYLRELQAIRSQPGNLSLVAINCSWPARLVEAETVLEVDDAQTFSLRTEAKTFIPRRTPVSTMRIVLVDYPA